MDPGSIRIILNWESSQDDLNIYSLQVNKNNDKETCLTYHNNMDGCSASNLNQDIVNGGSSGAETITYHDIAQNSMYTHMVFVNDITGNNALAESKARITVTDGATSVTIQMPKMDDSVPAGSKYWFAGCMRISGESFEFVPQGQYSVERIDDLF